MSKNPKILSELNPESTTDSQSSRFCLRKRDRVCYKEENASNLDSSISSFKEESKLKKKRVGKKTSAKEKSSISKGGREINNQKRIQSLFEILNKSKEVNGVKGRLLEMEFDDLLSDYSDQIEGLIEGLLIDFDWRKLGFAMFVSKLILE